MVITAGCGGDPGKPQAAVVSPDSVQRRPCPVLSGSGGLPALGRVCVERFRPARNIRAVVPRRGREVSSVRRGRQRTTMAPRWETALLYLCRLETDGRGCEDHAQVRTWRSEGALPNADLWR